MSGGHFDYGCFRISQFADELKHEIDTNGDETMNDLGEKRGYGFEAGTIARLKAAHQIIEQAGKLAREVEWLYSGDHGEESFCRLLDQHMGMVE